jgi:hypothetical protein
MPLVLQSAVNRFVGLVQLCFRKTHETGSSPTGSSASSV